jgi:hypothetical protein
VDFLEICANIYSRTLLVVGKENENMQPANAEFGIKGVKCANLQIYCVWCLCTRVNVSRDITH